MLSNQNPPEQPTTSEHAQCWDGSCHTSRESQSAMGTESEDRHHWIEEIAFLEARLNGSQGDIDREDRSACEEALKAAKSKLAACR